MIVRNKGEHECLFFLTQMKRNSFAEKIKNTEHKIFEFLKDE